MQRYLEEKEPTEFRRRLYVITCAVLLVFFSLGARLWYLQVIMGAHFQELSLNNRIRLMKTTAPRGIIYDRSGIRLAENRPGFDLAIVPEDVSDMEHTIETLSKLVDIGSATIQARLGQARARPPFQSVRIKEDLSWEEMVKVENFKFKLPGVILQVGPKRAYTLGVAMSHMLGYLGEVNDTELKASRQGNNRPYGYGDLVGKYGIEKTLEQTLRGKNGGRQVEVDAMGRELRVINRIPPQPGNNVRLTIDAATQLAAWDALKDVSGAAVAIDPRNGRILALVSTPSFDPNALTAGVTRDEWNAIVRNPFNILTNKVIQGQYPPASTFKPLLAAAALEDEIIDTDTTIFAGSYFRFGGRNYRDWKKEGHGEINLHRAIVRSSDTFFYQVGLKVGLPRIAHYARTFGLGQRTGVVLRNEKPGLVPTSQWKKQTFGEPWYRGETISVSVGQGFMLATPIQIASAYAAISNDGTLFRPQIIEEITTSEGEVTKIFKPERRGTLAVSKKTLAFIREALRGVVNEKGGTAGVIKMKDIVVAGKTGTAQVASSKERVEDIEETPYRLRDHAWFVGFAPYEDPRIVVCVLVEHGGFGSRAAAPVARKIFRAYLTHSAPRSEDKEQRL